MSEFRPRVSEFKKFINLLMSNAPKGYTPWLIKLVPRSKDPISGISWKDPKARLTIDQAIEYMENGGNIGIAGTSDDSLVNMDADGGIIQLSEVKKTLMVKSRSRVGLHAFYWNFDKEKIPNIATNKAGEVRSNWQYVVCPGSYVPITDPKKFAEIPSYDLKNAGYYTLFNEQSPVTISFFELPKVFRDEHKKDLEVPIRKPSSFDPKKATGKHSALFDITALDVCLREGGKTNTDQRFPSLFHDSDTQKNMSLSNQGLLQCWRHNCSLNGLQSLVVLSGYMNCKEAGSHHKGAGGSSRVTGNDGAIFHAWLYAKKHGYIPLNDPIPVKAMNYIAEKHLNFKAEKNKPLPWKIYFRVLKIVETEY